MLHLPEPVQAELQPSMAPTKRPRWRGQWSQLVNDERFLYGVFAPSATHPASARLSLDRNLQPARLAGYGSRPQRCRAGVSGWLQRPRTSVTAV